MDRVASNASGRVVVDRNRSRRKKFPMMRGSDDDNCFGAFHSEIDVME